MTQRYTLSERWQLWSRLELPLPRFVKAWHWMKTLRWSLRAGIRPCHFTSVNYHRRAARSLRKEAYMLLAEPTTCISMAHHKLWITLTSHQTMLLPSQRLAIEILQAISGCLLLTLHFTSRDSFLAVLLI